MKRFTLLLVMGAILVAGTAFAQDDNDDTHTVSFTIPEIALLDIEPAASKNISFTVTAPTEAGDPVTITGSPNTDLWLNVTSLISTTNDPTRTISAQITTGTVPGGLDLQVQAADDAGNGLGTAGTAGAAVTLDDGASHTLVTGVASLYTGNGASNGYNLTYSLGLNSSDYGNLDADDSAGSVTVTYTLSDN